MILRYNKHTWKSKGKQGRKNQMDRNLFSWDSRTGGGHKRWLRLCLLAVSGALTGLSVAVSGLFFLTWIAPLPAMGVILSYTGDVGRCYSTKRGKASRPRGWMRSLWGAYGHGVLFFFCYYLMAYHWFCAMYPLSFLQVTPAASVGLTLFAWLGLSLLHGAGGGLVFLFSCLLLNSGFFSGKRRGLFLPVPGMLWALNEFSQNFFFWGVPWGRLSLSQVTFAPLLSTVSLFGSTFLSFLLILFNTALAFLLTGFLRRKKGIVITAGVLLVTLCLCLTGLFLPSLSGNSEKTGSLRVGLIQGNLSSLEKWGRTPDESVSYHLSLLEEAAKQGATLLLLPETAIPFFLGDRPDLQEKLSGFAAEYRVTLVFGSIDQDAAGRHYNVLFSIDPSGEWMPKGYYAKQKLVPFGEYIPWQGLVETVFPALGELSTLGGTFAPGSSNVPLELGEAGRFAPLLCFDSIYPALTRTSVRQGADAILLATNDSWFDGSLAKDMHYRQARMRAAECGRPLFRVGNTGKTCIIDAYGGIVASMDPDVPGVLVETVAPEGRDTLYLRVGELFPLLSFLLLAGTTAAGWILSARGKKAGDKAPAPLQTEALEEWRTDEGIATDGMATKDMATEGMVTEATDAEGIPSGEQTRRESADRKSEKKSMTRRKKALCLLLAGGTLAAVWGGIVLVRHLRRSGRQTAEGSGVQATAGQTAAGRTADRCDKRFQGRLAGQKAFTPTLTPGKRR